MQKINRLGLPLLALALGFLVPEPVVAQAPAPARPEARRQQPQGNPEAPAPRSRRSQRVRMQEIAVASPDTRVRFTLLPNAERLTFKVNLGDTLLIEPSAISMCLDGHDLSSGVAFTNVEYYEVNETYPWRGSHSTATNHCNGARVFLQHDGSATDYILEIRAFNDGVAFRHIIPGAPNVARTPDEYSTFVIPPGSATWHIGLSGHYEDDYHSHDISQVEAGDWAGPPLTFRLPRHQGYAAITEANLVHYSGMALEADGRRGWTIGLGHRQPLSYPFELRYGRDEGIRLSKAASITGPITTPWRVIMAARDLNTLVNSTIVPNLCPPPDPALFPQGINTPWIKPGRAVWRYLDGGPTGVDGMKEFSRLAAQLGFEYQVIEGFWARWSPQEQKDVINFSKQQGVGIWLWHHTRTLRTPQARNEFFTQLNDLGATGAKIDFFDHEHLEIVDLYEDLLRDAAEHKISVIFHGANKPTGRQRTWPNDAVREAVRGMESSRLTERARHQTILPFTRWLAGPADYTVMLFNQRRGDTSCANQIASLAILDSPLLTIAANPLTILTNPALDLIKSIPTVWDETIVLPVSDIEELAAYARRSGDTWFVAAMCGTRGKTFQVPLSFLSKTEYRAFIVRDAPKTPTCVTVETRPANRSESLTVNLPPGGGFIARFTRQL